MKKIKLTQDKYALVDDKDFEYLNQFKWSFTTRGYAVRCIGGRKNPKTIFMHRLINNTPKDLETDHINQNKLDNRKCNLRSVTRNQNMVNIRKKNNTSGYTGVQWSKQAKMWRAGIMVNGKQQFLGLFKNIQGAVFARKEAERRVFTS